MLKAVSRTTKFRKTRVIFSRNTKLVSHEILKNFIRKKLECQPSQYTPNPLPFIPPPPTTSLMPPNSSVGIFFVSYSKDHFTRKISHIITRFC